MDHGLVDIGSDYGHEMEGSSNRRLAYELGLQFPGILLLPGDVR